MTIFDSLKYPISNPVTKEELDALPTDMFKKGIKILGFGGECSSRWVASYYIVYPNRMHIHNEMNKLRVFISSYENDNI